MNRSLGLRGRGAAAAGTALLLTLFGAGPASLRRASAPGFASFPGPPPPVQITRNLSLPEAARAGVVQLTPKGGFEGDDVALELNGKQVKAPITVSLHLEFSWESGHSEQEQEHLRDTLPRLEQRAENELNKLHYKTPKGEPINFDFDYKFRPPGQPADPSYDQVKVIDPKKDLPEPDPDRRAEVEGLGVPNTDTVVDGTFPKGSLQPSILAHESLHFIGLDDRYTDVYTYKGREVALPERGMSPKDLADFLKAQKPPIPPPPAGNVEAKDSPGTGRCDIMGSGSNLACRKISKRDLKWIESQAGVQVEAKPGELLLNKTAEDQNLAVAYPTRVIAPRGGTTVAPGVAGFCIDHHKSIPATGAMDVGPSTSALPGYSGVERLLNTNAELQPSLGVVLGGLQVALWNQTDGTQFAEDFAEPQEVAEARALMARAGVAENTNPNNVLQHLADPNAAAAATGAVDASGAIMPPIPSEAVPPPPAISARSVVLVPNKVGAHGTARTSLVVGIGGEVSGLALKLQRRAGHHWKAVKSLPGRKVQSGESVIPLNLGRLKAGKYRLRVTVSGPVGPPVVRTAGWPSDSRKRRSPGS